MYLYITVYCSLIFYSQIVYSGGYFDFSNKYPETLVDQIYKLGLDSPEINLINILNYQSENADTKKIPEQSDQEKTSIYSSRVGAPVGAVGVENTIIDEHNDKHNSLDNSRILPIVTNMQSVMTRIFNDSIFYWDYPIETISDRYTLIVNIFYVASLVSRYRDRCDLANETEIPYATRGSAMKNMMDLENVPNDRLASLLEDFHYLYTYSQPFVYSGKLYTTDSSCSRLILSTRASSEYFASSTGTITAHALAGRVKTLCPILEQFKSYEVSYRSMVIPNELNSRLIQVMSKISAVTDPIHQSSTKISDFCHELIQSPQIAAFITDNIHAIDYISCNVRNVFNVASLENNDYRLCIGAFESLIEAHSRNKGSGNIPTTTPIPNIRISP